jgi:hypothetical protein
VTCALRRRAVVASIESAVVEAGMDDVTVDAFPTTPSDWSARR